MHSIVLGHSSFTAQSSGCGVLRLDVRGRLRPTHHHPRHLLAARSRRAIVSYLALPNHDTAPLPPLSFVVASVRGINRRRRSGSGSRSTSPGAARAPWSVEDGGPVACRGRHYLHSQHDKSRLLSFSQASRKHEHYHQSSIRPVRTTPGCRVAERENKRDNS